MNRAAFLDRDGTLIAEKNYLHDPAQVEILPGVPSALRRLQQAGYKLIIISNQSGVGRGYFTLEDVEKVHQHLRQELGRAGVHLDQIYIAPEAPDQPSRGRKPSPQLLFDARDEFHLDLSRSYMIGDKLIDLQCGWNAGLGRSLLVRTGYGAEVARSMVGQLGAAIIVDDLGAAADWILRQNCSVAGA
jgi:D-glycero-D-manno-heptose 1,7-bisphosphate phosphatase